MHTELGEQKQTVDLLVLDSNPKQRSDTVWWVLGSVSVQQKGLSVFFPFWNLLGFGHIILCVQQGFSCYDIIAILTHRSKLINLHN